LYFKIKLLLYFDIGIYFTPFVYSLNNLD